MTVSRAAIEDALVEALTFQGCEIRPYEGVRYLVVQQQYSFEDTSVSDLVPLDKVAADIQRALS